MGYWSDSIMGGDTPLDIQYMFEEEFGGEDINEQRAEDGEEPLPLIVPTTQQTHAFIADCDLADEDEFGIVLAFLLMQRGAPVDAKLRSIVQESYDLEVRNIVDLGWKDADARRKSLDDLRDKFAAYPDAGAKTEMPYQPGLMETIYAGIGVGSGE